MSENTREIVLDTLLVLEKGEDFSNRLVKAVLDKFDYLSAQEKSFIKRVTEGTIERQIELDYYLNQFSTVPVKKMKPLIRNLLRMSIYQIIYMDAVPDSAVCNEACKLAGKRKFQNLKGFVNAVLRNVSKQKDNLPLPDKDKESLLYLSVKYSMPEWLVEMWMNEYGYDITEKLLQGLLQIHPVSLRFSSKSKEAQIESYINKIREYGANKGLDIRIKESEYLPYVYTVDNLDGIDVLPGFKEGAFTVQDISSVLSVEAADIGANDFLIDVCGAPGGKSILASEKAYKVLSRDVSEAKCAIIDENLKRMQVENVTVQVYDGTSYDESLCEQADVVILDVPCSGLGVMGKKRDIKYHVTKEGLESITALQKQIVENSWKYVKPGGVLLYSTCTINRAENQEMVEWILQNFPFEPESLERYIPKKLIEDKMNLRKQMKKKETVEEKISDACIQLLPGFMDADGFFFARLKRV